MTRTFFLLTLGAVLSLVCATASVIATPPLQPYWKVTGNAGTNPAANFLGTTDGQPLVIATDGVEAARVDPAGRVGIGTTTPNAKLEVVGTSDQEQLAVRAFSTQFRFIASFYNSFGTHVLGIGNGGEIVRDDPFDFIMGTTSNSGGSVLFRANGVERMRVRGETGFVGIGTSFPQDKLEVSGGNIRVTGGSFIDDGTSLNVPDYVFESNYRLMPLEELGKYIAREKHLPNIPSEREIKKTGLNVSQFQMKLLEKIEELTRYTLAQEEMLRSQQTRIEALEGTLRKLTRSR